MANLDASAAINLVDLLRDPELVDFFRTGARQFNYSAPVAAADGGCQQAFTARQFVHHDWVDGQDMVQAGQTADNNGFNFLFHNLEHDLDSAKTDVATLFGCVARLRQQVAAALAEVRAELNRVDADLWTLTPNKSLAPPKPGLLVGVTQYAGKNVAILRNDDGTLTSMAISDPVVKKALPLTLTDRVGNAADFAVFAAGSTDLAGMFTAGHTATTQDVITKVGEQPLANGKKVSDVLALLPAATVFHTVADVTNAVADAEASVVRSSADASASRAALGVTGATTTAGAALSNVGLIDSATSDKLAAAGIHTVADLSNADPAKLAASGAAASAGDAARLIAVGRTLRGLN